jgi:predicted transcriptional regulator
MMASDDYQVEEIAGALEVSRATIYRALQKQ